MRNWVIALPVWGDYCRGVFAKHCLPSWKAALEPIRDRVRIVLHTDRADFANIFGDLPVDVRVPPERGAYEYHAAFANAHRQTLAEAAPGEMVAIQNADHVLSSECFIAAEKRFEQGKKLIVCAGPRTVGPIFEPAPVMKAADLLDWAMHYAHTITQQSTYPNGQSGVSSVLYFRDGDNTIMRAFHLHPFAVLKDRELGFKGTVDADLCDRFDTSEIHVVTDPHELAMAEISPPHRRFALRPDAMTDDYLFWWGQKHASPMHWWFFMQRIVLQGDGSTDCDAVAERVVRRRFLEAA